MSNDKIIELFGRVSVRAGGRFVDQFATVHCKNLLLYFAMHPDFDHPRDRLVQALWPGANDGSARNRLSVTLYHLRHSLEELDPSLGQAFVSRRAAMRLDSQYVRIDLHEFRKVIAEARAARDPATKRKCYSHATALYKGPLAPDCGASWAIARQFEASDMFQEAAVWLAQEHELRGEREEAHAVLSSALDVEPFSERATELLTSWYSQTGRVEMAIAVAKRMQRSMASSGRAPSKAMLRRIEELNVMMSGQSKAVAFADDCVITVLACTDFAFEEFERCVKNHGGRIYGGGLFGLFTNPLSALAAGRDVLACSTEACVLLCPVLMAMNDPLPREVRTRLGSLKGRGLYGTECFSSLVRSKGVETHETAMRGESFWRVT
jgi:DNA-binding SARP family transcriptional activator